MKRVIELAEGKVLKLHKVLTKVLSVKELEQMPQTIQVFQGFILSNGLTPKGPMVLNDNPEGCKLLWQLSDAPKKTLAYPYSYAEELRVENCLYIRFTGDKVHTPIAYSKMDVYAYENDLELLGNTYSIFLGTDEAQMCDIFSQIAP
jgi:hypothetical protein